MNAAQQAAFRGANPGSWVTEANLLMLCAGLVCAVAIAWCAWVAFHAYKNWSGGGATPGEAGGHVLRAVFLTVVVLAVVTW